MLNGPPPGCGASVPSSAGTRSINASPATTILDHAATVLFRSVSVDPRAGQLPTEGDLIDVDALLAAYFERAAGGARGVRHVRPPRHVARRLVHRGARRRHQRRGVPLPRRAGDRAGRSTSAATRTRSRRPPSSTIVEVLAAHGVDVVVDTDDGATPTPVISHAILTHNRGGSRAHDPPADGIVVTPVAQPARRRRLQVQPAARRARPTPTSRAGSSARRTSCSRAGSDDVPRERGAGAGRPRLRLRLRRRPRLGDRPRRDPGRRPAARRRPARRREPRLLAGDPRPPRARPRDRQRGARPDVPVRPARLGREDPDGLLVAVRDGAAARHGRPLRRRVRERPRRRPARDRHAVRRAAQPEPPPRGLRLLPVRRRARLGPGRRDRQDARVVLDHRPRRRGPRAPARRGAGRLQVVRPRAASTGRSGSAARRAPARRSCAATARPGAPTRTG